jgi:hypothetical protein
MIGCECVIFKVVLKLVSNEVVASALIRIASWYKYAHLLT